MGETQLFQSLCCPSKIIVGNTEDAEKVIAGSEARFCYMVGAGFVYENIVL